jgi:ABC-type uncharacterized transport system ATPase subunit
MFRAVLEFSIGVQDGILDAIAGAEGVALTTIHDSGVISVSFGKDVQGGL